MKYKISQSGFTLVETLVSITILLIVLIGPMTISSQAAKSSSFSSEQVTAFFLAQEGVEIAQKARDDLLVRSFATDATAQERTPWTAFTNTTNSGQYRQCYIATEGCGLEIRIHSGNGSSDIVNPVDCGSPAQNDCDLWYSASNVRSKFTHTQGGNEFTPYNRRVYFTVVPGTNSNEVIIRSVVTWQSGNIRNEQRVEVESRLFNLYGN